MVFPNKYSMRATILGVILAISIWLLCLVVFKSDQLRLATSYTGRVSAILFLPVFVARPMVDLFGQTRFGILMRQRSSFGLALAGNHHIHMILLTVYLIGEGAGKEAFLLNPGLYIYFLLVLMNVTSFPSSRKILSKRTINIIHIAGLYALAIAFFETLVLSVFTGQEGGVFRLIYSGLFLLAIGIRVAAKISNKKSA